MGGTSIKTIGLSFLLLCFFQSKPPTGQIESLWDFFVPSTASATFYPNESQLCLWQDYCVILVDLTGCSFLRQWPIWGGRWLQQKAAACSPACCARCPILCSFWPLRVRSLAPSRNQPHWKLRRCVSSAASFPSIFTSRQNGPFFFTPPPASPVKHLLPHPLTVIGPFFYFSGAGCTLTVFFSNKTF